MVNYLKEKENGILIKTAIAGDDFNLVTMMFVYGSYFLYLVKKTNSNWDEELQQNQRTVDFWGVFLRVPVRHLKLDKGYWYPILWGCTYWKPTMLSSENSEDVHHTKIDGE